MSDFLDNLMTRALDPSASFLPRPASLFEPLPPSALQPTPATAGEEVATTEIPYAILRSPAEGKTPAPRAKATAPLPVPETPVEAGVQQPSPVIRNTGPAEATGATPLEAPPSMRGLVEKKASAEPASPPPSEVAPGPPPETPAAEPTPGQTKRTAEPLAQPSRSPVPKERKAIDTVEPAPLQSHGETAPPGNGDREKRDTTRTTTLSAMVRQWVLQPATREVVLRPEVPPAEIQPSAVPASPNLKTQEGHEERPAARPLTELPAHRRKADSTPLHPDPGFNRVKPAPEHERENLSAAEERHSPSREAAPPSAPLKPLATKLPPFPPASRQPPEVHISIGRVEVRAYPAKPEATPTPRRQPQPEVMSLDAYLAQRTRGKG